MDGDRRLDAGDFDSHPPDPPVAIKSSRWKPALMMLVILLASAALALSTLAVQRNRDQDREAAIEEIERARAQAVAQCEALNQSRRNNYDSNLALATLAVTTARTPVESLPPLIIDFVNFTQVAFDPVSCDPNDPNFGVDATPPAPLQHPLIESLLNESPSQ